MNKEGLARIALSLLVLVGIVMPLYGGMIDASFSGTFTQDDNVQLFSFTVANPASVTLRTWSFAGGVNAAGEIVPGGGFAPVLSLFDPSGNWLVTDRDGGTADCGPRATDSASHFCWDAYLNSNLSPGVYTLALTQDDNTPAGSTLADGFLESGNGNFTGSLFLGPGGAGLSFILIDGEQRTAQWAVDILQVDAAAETPEPASLLLAMAGLAFVVGRKFVASKPKFTNLL